MSKAMEAFESWLRTNHIPYVSVDEAKKSMAGATKLKSFHFVVYGDSGGHPNLLTYVTDRPAPLMRRDMELWQEVFGEGFLSVFVKMQAEQPLFQRLDGESFVWNGKVGEVLAKLIVQVQSDGDHIPLIEYLNDQSEHEIYAQVEDAMADAGSGGDTATEQKLSDWLDDYRQAVIEGRPTPEPPQLPAPLDAPSYEVGPSPVPDPKAEAGEGTTEEPPARVADVGQRIQALLKEDAARSYPGSALYGRQESYRLKINQIEFLLQGFPENFRQAVRSAIYVEINEVLDRVWEYVQGLPCPDPSKRARISGKPGKLAQPRVYEPLVTQATHS